MNYFSISMVHLVQEPYKQTNETGGPWDPSSAILGVCERFRVIALIPLIDSVVCYCDALSARLGLFGNDPETSFYRVDKEGMQRACRERGLGSIRSIRVSSEEHAVHVWEAEFGGGEVVCKPPRSGGGDGVQVCSTEEEIRTYMRRFHNALSLERFKNTDIVMQPVHGMSREFVVNTVSVKGNHFATDVWMSDTKRSGKQNVFLYDVQELVTDKKIANCVSEYVKQVLSACGVQYGACHTEVAGKMSAEGNVSDLCLIEVNARVAGEIRTDAQIPGWSRYDQIFWLIQSIVAPIDRVAAIDDLPFSINPASSVLAVFLKNFSEKPACVVSLKGIETIRALPSFVRFGRGLAFLNNMRDDDFFSRCLCLPPIGKTVDLISSPGVVVLVGPSAHQDANAIRILEANSLYLNHNTF